MFECKVQEAWEGVHEDFGLGRISLITCLFSVLFFFLSGTHFGEFLLLTLLPIFIFLIVFLYRQQILRWSELKMLAFFCLVIALVCSFNYTLVGVLDQMAQGLPRQDHWLEKFDHALFGMTIAEALKYGTNWLGPLQTHVYDLAQIVYALYFILPFYAVITIYRFVSSSERMLVLGRLIGSITLLFHFNFLLYLFVPVEGPFRLLQEELPQSDWSIWIREIIIMGQATFIDCFPSGHFGMCLLIYLWLKKLKHPQRFLLVILTPFMIFATLGLGYHYILDLVMSIPLVLICIKLSYILIPIAPINKHKDEAHGRKINTYTYPH